MRYDLQRHRESQISLRASGHAFHVSLVYHYFACDRVPEHHGPRSAKMEAPKMGDSLPGLMLDRDASKVRDT